jgi:hypothetical protein
VATKRVWWLSIEITTGPWTSSGFATYAGTATKKPSRTSLCPFSVDQLGTHQLHARHRRFNRCHSALHGRLRKNHARSLDDLRDLTVVLTAAIIMGIIINERKPNPSIENFSYSQRGGS